MEHKDSMGNREVLKEGRRSVHQVLSFFLSFPHPLPLSLSPSLTLSVSLILILSLPLILSSLKILDSALKGFPNALAEYGPNGNQ